MMVIKVEMPKLNRVLISSIMSQVGELVSLSNEISTWLVGKIDFTNGVRDGGLKNAFETLKDYRGTAGEMYILLLELAYEKINSVLRLIIEFLDYHSKFETHENNDKILLSLVRGGNNYTTAASTVKLLWLRLKALPEMKKINSRLVERLAFVDEYKNAVGYRLALITDSKIALEKTVDETRKEMIELQKQKEIEISNIKEQRRNIIRMTKSTQTIERIKEEKNERKNQSVFPITADDDPVIDMTREISSNKKKIDELLRQNERLSRALVRISQHNKNRGNEAK